MEQIKTKNAPKAKPYILFFSLYDVKGHKFEFLNKMIRIKVEHTKLETDLSFCKILMKYLHFSVWSHCKDIFHLNSLDRMEINCFSIFEQFECVFKILNVEFKLCVFS